MVKKTEKNPIIKIKLSQYDQRLLSRYCALHNISQNTAIKRILRIHLEEALPQIDDIAENQLGLFDPIQMNIFDK